MTSQEARTIIAKQGMLLDVKEQKDIIHAFTMANDALRTVSEIKKCIDFHKLNETPFDELSGFESFVIEQICGGDTE